MNHARPNRTIEKHIGRPNEDDPRTTSSEDDIVQEVLKDRRGWTRGVGQKLPKFVFARASCSSAQRMYTADDVRQMFT